MKIDQEEYKKRLRSMIDQAKAEGKENLIFSNRDFCAGMCEDPKNPGQIWDLKMNSCCYTAGRFLRNHISEYGFVSYPYGRAQYTIRII